MGEGYDSLVFSSPWDFKISFTGRKILRHGTSGFTSHLKEDVLRNFIALKNPSPLPGSNPRPLGPVASTLIITPPRRLNCTGTGLSPSSSVFPCRYHFLGTPYSYRHRYVVSPHRHEQQHALTSI
jgi:hypothetical protein